jgi:hypothetical protein
MYRKKSVTVDVDDGCDLAETKPMKSHRSYTDLFDVSHAVDIFTALTPYIYAPTVISKKLGSTKIDQSIIVIRRRQSFPSLEGDKLRRLIRRKQFI